MACSSSPTECLLYLISYIAMITINYKQRWLMFITYLKLLKSLTSITKIILTEWPGSLCILSAAPECPKWESYPPVRAREGVDISTIPKVSAGLKDDVSCPMRKHLLSAWSVEEQWVSITHRAPRKGISHQLLPYLLKHECSHKMLWCIPDSFSSAESLQSPLRNCSRLMMHLQLPFV